MTLYEHMKKYSVISDIWEFTVFDRDYDTEVYFYPSDEDVSDEFREMAAAEDDLAKKLTVLDCDESGNNVTVDLCDVIERNINNGVFEKLFIENNLDSIMADIDKILAGYVSERWFVDFVDSLN